jgi:excisionase family DNA binding protein
MTETCKNPLTPCKTGATIFLGGGGAFAIAKETGLPCREASGLEGHMDLSAETGSGWPLLMDDRTLASMLNVTKPGLRRLVSKGHIPAARELGGLERWHRDEVAGHLRRLWKLDAAEQAMERQRDLALAALDGWGKPGAPGKPPKRRTRQ